MFKAGCPKKFLPENTYWERKELMPQTSKQSASEIVTEFLKKQKNTDKIDVATVEEQSDGWMVRGTCPINLEGHPWAEKFAVVVDWKGKIKTTNYALL